MLRIDWSEDKNTQLQAERNISFEQVIIALEGGRLLDIVNHPNQTKYPGQMILLVEIDEYIYLVPFIIEGDLWFLKTVIPSRKATKSYLRNRRIS